LGQTIFDTPVDRRSRITMETAAPALRSKVDVHSEKHIRLLSVARAADDLPLRDEGLAAGRPRGVGRVDAAWVVLEGRPVEDGVGIGRAAGVGLVEADERWLVQVRGADVAAGCAAVFVVDGDDVGEGVGGAAGSADEAG
jgi:hypothetical protein